MKICSLSDGWKRGCRCLSTSYQKNVVAAFNAAVGSWLLKPEAGYIEGFEFFNTPDKSYYRTDVLAGIEYSGFNKDSRVSIEAINRHINDFDKNLV